MARQTTMKPIDRRSFLKSVPAVAMVGRMRWQPMTTAPFGADYAHLDSQTTGRWWAPPAPGATPSTGARGETAKRVPQIVDLNVPRDRVVAFALYTQDSAVLKLTAQLFPLLPDEPREARLEVQRNSA